MKKILLITVLILCGGLFIFFRPAERAPAPQEIKENPVIKFVNKQFILKNGGVLIENTDRNTVLSEAIGLYLLACVKLDRRARFDKTYEFTKKELFGEYRVMYWKINLKTGKKNDSAASLDDLRLVRALLEAWEAWGDDDYLQEAMKMADAIKKTEFNAGYMVDSFTWTTRPTKSGVVNISYLELYTMEKLAKHDPDWSPIYERSKQLTLDSVREDGLFWQVYDLGKRKFRHNDGNVINEVLTALHLAEVGVPAEDIKPVAFFSKLLDEGDGKIPNTFNADGIFTSKDESSAIYAIAARLYRLLGDAKHERIAFDKMLAFQNKDQKSPYFGGFGMFAPFQRKAFNSFDNLQALLTVIEQ